MKPKKKAKELVQKFSKLEKGLDEKEWFKREVSFNGNNKQCALICVDEILNLHIPQSGYWTEVKQEINKL